MYTNDVHEASHVRTNLYYAYTTCTVMYKYFIFLKFFRVPFTGSITCTVSYLYLNNHPKKNPQKILISYLYL